MYKLGLGLVAYKMTDDEIRQLSEMLSNFSFVYKVVVDNSPTNDSEKMFELYNWTYISKTSNPGFGKSHNLIFDKFGSNSDFHLVINPDIIFNTEILPTMLDFLISNQFAGAVMPAVYYPNGEYQNLKKILPTPLGWFLRRFFPNSSITSKYNYFFELQMFDDKLTIKLPYLSGCFILFRSEIIRKIGFFDTRYFMYCEDTDISRRLWLNNTPGYYLGSVSIMHKFAKGSHSSFKLLIIAVLSTIKYFNKWGWFGRNCSKINKQCLFQFQLPLSEISSN